MRQYLVIISVILAGFSFGCSNPSILDQPADSKPVVESPFEDINTDAIDYDNLEFPGEGEYFEDPRYTDAFLGFEIANFPEDHTYKGDEEGEDYQILIFNSKNDQVGLITISPWSRVDSLALGEGDVIIDKEPARKSSITAPTWSAGGEFVLTELESTENNIIVTAILHKDIETWFEGNWRFLSADEKTTIKNEGSLLDKAYDVFDLYMMLPDAYFDCDTAMLDVTSEYKMEAIEEEDLENGYLKADLGFPLEVMMLESSDEYYWLAVLVDCGEACMCNTLEVKKLVDPDTWEDSRYHLPFTEMGSVEAKYQGESEVYFYKEFDQYEKAINFFDDSNAQLVYQLVWNGEEFEVRE